MKKLTYITNQGSILIQNYYFLIQEEILRGNIRSTTSSQNFYKYDLIDLDFNFLLIR